jgi:hypothetical protein
LTLLLGRSLAFSPSPPLSPPFSSSFSSFPSLLFSLSLTPFEARLRLRSRPPNVPSAQEMTECPVLTPCQHLLCQDCVEHLFAAGDGHTSRCPTCRMCIQRHDLVLAQPSPSPSPPVAAAMAGSHSGWKHSCKTTRLIADLMTMRQHDGTAQALVCGWVGGWVWVDVYVCMYVCMCACILCSKNTGEPLVSACLVNRRRRVGTFHVDTMGVFFWGGRGGGDTHRCFLNGLRF